MKMRMFGVHLLENLGEIFMTHVELDGAGTFLTFDPTG